MAAASASTIAANAASVYGLQGLKCLCTGGTKGIGYAIAEQFGALGARVFICSRSAGDVERAVAALRARGYAADGAAADVTLAADRAALLSRVSEAFGGELDVLVNNVGRNVRKPTAEYTDDERDGIFATNYDSAFAMTQLCFPLLKRAADAQGGGGGRGRGQQAPTAAAAAAAAAETAGGGGGAGAAANPSQAPAAPAPAPPLLRRRAGASVLFNSSVAAGPAAMRSGALYASTKAALNQLTRYLAAEWAPFGIRVNAVCPWYTRTELAEQVLKDERFSAAVLASTPAGRVGETREVAAAFAFLASPGARFITGQCLGVDGGYASAGFWPDASVLPGGGGGEPKKTEAHPALAGGEF